MSRRLAAALFALPILAACAPEKPLEYVVHQSVVVADAGKPTERRVEVLEDGRFTPPMREAMWGGSKDPADFLKAPGVQASDALKKSFDSDEPRRAIVRLIDHDGKTLDQRRLDCELAALSDHALPQGEGTVWVVGNECSTGSGLYAGLITHFFTIKDDKFAWQPYQDAATGERAEMTVVQALRIGWQIVPKDRVDTVLEVACHPDFQDPRLQALKPGEAPPDDVPLVVDYIRYTTDGAGGWLRRQRTVKNECWDERAAFPDVGKFPG